ncbi:MAG TPA: tetratricopeptide repeat protein [Bryobacteraceae bacterium]|nr:tetratricopeptide repeat protein [Bryobacteraceae bacterium]
MASNLTRKALLKQDKFTAEAQHTVTYLAEHRKEATRYGVIALIVAVVVAAVYYYRISQHSVREQVLGEAMTVANAVVGGAQPNVPSFPTQAAKDDAVTKAFTKVAADYSGTEEGYVAEYYLGAKALDAGKVDDARKRFQDVADHANADYASLGKLSLAQLDVAENRIPEAESIVKDLAAHPTALVSATQANFLHAQILAVSKPEEARKIYQQIAAEKSDAAALAVTAMNDLPQK